MALENDTSNGSGINGLIYNIDFNSAVLRLAPDSNIMRERLRCKQGGYGCAYRPPDSKLIIYNNCK